MSEGASKYATVDGVVETDLLIIGAGPAGASLACFLAHYGSWQVASPPEHRY